MFAQSSFRPLVQLTLIGSRYSRLALIRLERQWLKNALTCRSYASTPTGLFNKDDPFMKDYANNASQRSTDDQSRDRDYWEDAAIVQTTGILGKEGRKLHARIGVYWGQNDEMNVYKAVEPVDDSVVSSPLAEIDAVNMALRQAIHERGITRLIVETDSEFVVKCVERWLKAWKSNGFMKKDGTPVKNRQYLEELARLLETIEVKFIFTHNKNRYDNDVIGALKGERGIAEKIEADKEIFQIQALIKEPPKDSNVIYACGTTQDVTTKYKNFILAGYGVHWPAHSDRDTCGRFAAFPVTHFRVQMQAIISALELAAKHGLTTVHIVTDSDRFLRFYRNDWKKLDGNPVANYPLYQKIIALQQNMTVTYSFMPPKFNPIIEQALLLAEDGLAHPIEKQQTQAPVQANLQSKPFSKV